VLVWDVFALKLIPPDRTNDGQSDAAIIIAAISFLTTREKKQDEKVSVFAVCNIFWLCRANILFSFILSRIGANSSF